MRTVFIALVLLLFLISCKRNGVPDEITRNTDLASVVDNQDSRGLELLKTRCYVCHNPEASSHEELLAPPLPVIKQRYMMQYPSKEEFTEALISWCEDPREEKALMRGAVSRFQVMPKQDFKNEELIVIASYVYGHDLQRPSWLAQHQREMHGQGRRGMRWGRHVE